LVVDVQKALSVHACFSFCNFSYQRLNCIFPAKMNVSVLQSTILRFFLSTVGNQFLSGGIWEDKCMICSS